MWASIIVRTFGIICGCVKTVQKIVEKNAEGMWLVLSSAPSTRCLQQWYIQTRALCSWSAFVQSCSAPCPVALLAHSCTGSCTAASRHSGAEGFSRGYVVVARANSAPSESASQVQPQYCSVSLRLVVFLHWQPYSETRSFLSAFLVMKLIWKLNSFQNASELFGLLRSHFQAVFSYLNSTFEKANPMSQDNPKITC